MNDNTLVVDTSFVDAVGEYLRVVKRHNRFLRIPTEEISDGVISASENAVFTAFEKIEWEYHKFKEGPK